MDDYRAVRGGHPLSLSIFDLLADTAPQLYPEFMRVSTIRRINDILQDRSKSGFTIEWLLDELLEKAGTEHPTRTEALCQEVGAFLAQKDMLTQPYTKTSAKESPYPTWGFDEKQPREIINQRLFDAAAKAGFPPGFFKESYFDGVTIYCMPDNADLSNSYFQDCSFSVCRIVGADFAHTSIYSSEFQSSIIENTSFARSTLAYTHFHDTVLTEVSFGGTRLSACNTIDCTMEMILFRGAILNGCSYDRVTAKGIQCLDTATVTMGGATEEECAKNRASIFEALGVALPVPAPERSTPTPTRPKRHTGPER